MGYYEIRRHGDSQFMFVLRAGNHQVILSSEAYASKAGALNGIASVRLHGVAPDAFERKLSVRGQPYFVLMATNGEPIGHSELYADSAAMENGIRSVISNAPSLQAKDKG